MRWILDLLRKNGLFANLKKCWFHKEKICFLDYIISDYSIRIENKKIKEVKNWPKPKSLWEIQIFISFDNFYRCFIQSFSKIAVPFTSMLKITKLFELALKAFRVDDEIVGSINSDGANKTVVDLSKSKKSKNDKSKIPIRINIGAIEEPSFLIPGHKKVFKYLKYAFMEASILQHFDLECHIQIKINTWGYAINRVPSYLNSDQLISDQGTPNSKSN